MNPRNINALNDKGVALLNLGEIKKGINCFNEILKIDPKDIIAILNDKGNALLNLGERRKAIDCYN